MQKERVKAEHLRKADLNYSLYLQGYLDGSRQPEVLLNLWLNNLRDEGRVVE